MNLTVCVVETFEKPELEHPVMIEGLPGIGFVANIAALHLIRQLHAVRFAEIHSSAFQDLAVTTDSGNMRSPVNELYFYKANPGSAERDLIIWYGNTQALTTMGQYELCERVLQICKEFGCNFFVTLGGYRVEEARPVPQTYAAATDAETLKSALNLGAKIMVGQIFGVAGLTVGLGRLKSMKGFSLLVETPGSYPDAAAATTAINILNKYLGTATDVTKIDLAAEETKNMLNAFGLIRALRQEKEKEEQPFRWFI